MNTKINLSGSLRVSGARYYLILDPEQRAVSDYAAVGNAVPMRVWHGRDRQIMLDPNVVGSELQRLLEGEEAQLIAAAIFDLYEKGERLGAMLSIVGRWPTDEQGLDTEELEGLELQLKHLLEEVPAFIDAGDWVGELDWFQFHDHTDLKAMVSEWVEEGRHDGFWLDPKDLQQVLTSWLQEAVSDLEHDDDRSDEEQKDLALGRRLLAGVA